MQEDMTSMYGEAKPRQQFGGGMPGGMPGQDGMPGGMPDQGGMPGGNDRQPRRPEAWNYLTVQAAAWAAA